MRASPGATVAVSSGPEVPSPSWPRNLNIMVASDDPSFATKRSVVKNAGAAGVPPAVWATDAT